MNGKSKTIVVAVVSAVIGAAVAHVATDPEKRRLVTETSKSTLERARKFIKEQKFIQK